ncbi:relaxase/mobilization nuclease domain-containing protein [Acidimangrovimonas pyrenivorans]|uniref:Relaxase/mobilization nuclease domain-containing protein n=1 Tax=Acidimangrovimonas pyrenivorans TaxID=2030798 RepID=A0ABV7ACK4_9RHOB
MILKGNARAGGSDLATHLLNAYDNEEVEIAELRGTIADDLHGAFAEFEAIASGTKARNALYSLSVNPSEELSREQYFEAIEAIENRLGLNEQPRAIVFHIKDGREHAHVVWSRIDALDLKAIHMAHDRRKLCDMAVQLAEQYGHELPEGLKAWKQREQFKKEKLEASLAERAQQKKTGITPEQRRAEVTQAYNAADNAGAFRNALEEKGYILANGDRRPYVLVDQFGDVHSLSRYVKGVKYRDMIERLGALDPAKLPSVELAKEQARERLKAAEERAREQQDRDHDRDEDEQHQRDDRDEKIKRVMAEKWKAMERAQAARRQKLAQTEQAMLLAQQQERLVLHAAQHEEASGRLFRMRSKVADLISGTPALQSVLGHIAERTGLDPRERHRLENEALERRHEREKIALEGQRKALDKIDLRERASLERDLKREALKNRAKQEAKRGAKEETERVQRTDPRLSREGALGDEFNEAAQADHHGEHDDGDGDDGDDLRNKWDRHADNAGERRRRGRGYKMSRDGD